VALDEAGAKVLCPVHICRHHDLEGGSRPRLRHPPGDRPPQRGQLDALDRPRRARRHGCGRRAGDRRPLDVLSDDPPLRPGARQGGEVDASLAGDPPGER
jgi:hypothetical protein